MSETTESDTAKAIRRKQRNVRVGVRNFGPIESGVVDLRPLTVFVGPSNTGKTYMSVLVYALHRSLSGFQVLPAAHTSLNYPYDLISATPLGIGQPEAQEVNAQTIFDFMKCIDLPTVNYSDLPAKIHANILAVLQDPRRLGTDVEFELKRCLDAGSTFDFIRNGRTDQALGISLGVGQHGRNLWNFNINMAHDHTTVSGHVEDMELIRSDAKSAAFKRTRMRTKLSHNPSMVWGTDLLDMATDAETERGTMHYLPAARSGIIQSQRLVTSSLIARTTRLAIERAPEIPTFSGVVADFMQQIVLYRSADPAGHDVALQGLADALEKETLAGQIGSRSLPGGYTDFAYRPLGTKQDIPLTRVSSMVSELAPVVLFLRGVVRVGDTLVIEEPEAHLHPAAQTVMAVTLARLVRAGVRVIVTTHSDWMLKEIANLMREGVLEEQAGRSDSESSQRSTLYPDEVGIWLFRQGEIGHGSSVQEIPFDRSEGVEPAEYDDVAEQLYNRAAYLQNELEESRRDARTESSAESAQRSGNVISANR